MRTYLHLFALTFMSMGMLCLEAAPAQAQRLRQAAPRPPMMVSPTTRAMIVQQRLNVPERIASTELFRNPLYFRIAPFGGYPFLPSYMAPYMNYSSPMASSGYMSSPSYGGASSGGSYSPYGSSYGYSDAYPSESGSSPNASYGAYPYPVSTNPAPVDIAVNENYFQPSQITVPVGTTIRWTNAGRHVHTVTSDSGGWDSVELAPGQSFGHSFTAPGVFAYHCDKHAKEMTAVVTVR
jgi:plastocyanin